MITVEYAKPFTNNIEKDVKSIRASYLADLERLRAYYGLLFIEASDTSKLQLRRVK